MWPFDLGAGAGTGTGVGVCPAGSAKAGRVEDGVVYGDEAITDSIFDRGEVGGT